METTTKRDIFVVDLLALPNSSDCLRYIGPLEDKSNRFVILVQVQALRPIRMDHLGAKFLQYSENARRIAIYRPREPAL